MLTGTCRWRYGRYAAAPYRQSLKSRDLHRREALPKYLEILAIGLVGGCEAINAMSTIEENTITHVSVLCIGSSVQACSSFLRWCR